jgi:hypothetical protein
MVKSSGFITGVASALGLPEPTVSGAFRALRENGLMTSGARGVNAPDMTDLDAARILIAMLVNERPAYAERSVRDFGQLICLGSYPVDCTGLSDEVREMVEHAAADFTMEARGLGDRHTFEQAVAELIRMYGDDREKDYWLRGQVEIPERGRFDPHTKIEVTPGYLEARISMQGNIYTYFDRYLDPSTLSQDDDLESISADLDAEETYNLKKAPYSTAIRSSRWVDTPRITALALVIREGGTPPESSLS